MAELKRDGKLPKLQDVLVKKNQRTGKETLIKLTYKSVYIDFIKQYMHVYWGILIKLKRGGFFPKLPLFAFFNY